MTKTAIFITVLFLSFRVLFGQTEGVSVNDCPKETMEVHLSQNNLFTGEMLWFKIYCVSPLFPSEEISSLAFIELVNSSNSSLVRKRILLKHGEGEGDFEIPDTLSTGIYHILAYTNWMKNFDEGNLAVKELIIINPLQPYKNLLTDSLNSVGSVIRQPAEKADNLTITNDKETYQTRQQVILKIERNSGAGQGLSSLSVSVCREEPDMVYGSQSKRSEMSNTSFGKVNFLPDYKGIRFSGKLLDETEKDIPDEYVTLSVIGKGTDIRESITDNRGNFNFMLKPGEGEKEIVLTLPEKSMKINVEESFLNGFRNPPSGRSLLIDRKALVYLNERFMYYQFRERFKKMNFVKRTPDKMVKDSTIFYSDPYQLIRLKDYVTLDSLREYFYELVPTVRFIKRKDRLDIEVRDSVSQSFYKDKPGVFVDGVIYNDYSQITRIPVKETDHLAVLPKTYYYKDFTFGGIIDIHTYKSDFNSVKLLPEMTRLIFPLADVSEWKFTAPDYSTGNSLDKTPDFRYLLYWNPEVPIAIGTDNAGKAEVKFYTGDVKGTFVIKITGLSSDGKILQAEKKFVVE